MIGSDVRLTRLREVNAGADIGPDAATLRHLI